MNDLINQFNRHYYESAVVFNTYWLGYKVLKYPNDLWVYQEMIVELQPDLIIESGTYLGGSALFLATVCDSINKGRILTIDINVPNNAPKHDRITYLQGSSTSLDVMLSVYNHVLDADVVLVILDSDHSKQHVLDEIYLYHTLVTPGSYLIVEDTIVNGHPVLPNFGPGPMEAVHEFLTDNNQFAIDKNKEKFLITSNPNGFLRKIC